MIRLAISNIAWDVSEDAGLAALLQRFDVDAIDIAPGKYFAQPETATRDDVEAVRRWWASQGIEITGMQALLFGTSGLNVFGSPDSRAAMQARLKAICRIGGWLGARKLVFGSPKNRDRSGLSDRDTLDQACHFFAQLGTAAAEEGVEICLEPNPACYGANFMMDSLETCKVVEAVNHPAIRMQLDTGAMTLNHEDPDGVLARCAPLIGHVHASEPSLVPLGDGGTDHDLVRAALSRYRPDSLVSIEMVATSNEPHLDAIERALTVAVRSYRDWDRSLTT